MSEEVIIINDEPFYRILNGTCYDYAPIPKEFKPYFERLQQENKHLKEILEKMGLEPNEILYLQQENKRLKKENEGLRELVEDWGDNQ